MRETFPREIRPVLQAPKDLWLLLGDATANLRSQHTLQSSPFEDSSKTCADLHLGLAHTLILEARQFQGQAGYPTSPLARYAHAEAGQEPGDRAGCAQRPHKGPSTPVRDVPRSRYLPITLRLMPRRCPRLKRCRLHRHLLPRRHLQRDTIQAALAPGPDLVVARGHGQATRSLGSDFRDHAIVRHIG